MHVFSLCTFMTCFLCPFETLQTASKVLQIHAKTQALMQDDFSKENSVKAGHLLKTETCKSSICLLLSDGVNNRAWIQKAYIHSLTHNKNVFFLMINFSSSSFQPNERSTCSSDPVVIIF